jgi:hypothetical protein
VDRTVAAAWVLSAVAAVGYGVATAPERAPSSADLDWSLLESYEHRPGLRGLPDGVEALHGKRVTVRGFLMPLTEWDDIHEFALVRHGGAASEVPGLSGQVLVRIRSKRGLPNTNEPIEVTGTFRVEEVKEMGFLLAIFSIVDAEARIVGY